MGYIKLKFIDLLSIVLTQFWHKSSFEDDSDWAVYYSLREGDNVTESVISMIKVYFYSQHGHSTVESVAYVTSSKQSSSYNAALAVLHFKCHATFWDL